MSEGEKMPRYMGKLLDELGWSKGNRIPLANSDNQILEDKLVERQNEIQRLKEALRTQNQKLEDIRKYKEHVQSEYQENSRLLFAHKSQLEQEVKLREVAAHETIGLRNDISKYQKQSQELSDRIEKFQSTIGRLLKKADDLKSEVCGERGALQEWRAALDRSSNDITAIEQFTKQDLSKAKTLETKRQQLKVEHDRLFGHLNEIVGNLAAEEKACERISVQVKECMERREQMMKMWSSAVENLRQRDTDIRHIREDYAVLIEESDRLAEKCREQQTFYEQQRANNAEAQAENVELNNKLSRIRVLYQELVESNLTLDSEVQGLQREASNVQGMLEKLRQKNRQIMEQQHRKDIALKNVNEKILELKKKVIDSKDKTKSSEKRAKELEDILNEEERYANSVTTNQQRATHCTFVEQQKLLALRNEEKLFRMQLRASKAIMAKLDSKQQTVEKQLQTMKENLYAVCYQVETYGARVLQMEGWEAGEVTEELTAKENRLKEVCARHAGRVALLERHSAKLTDAMRRLARDIETKGLELSKLESRLKSATLTVHGCDKELKATRDAWRKERVEESLMRLRVTQTSKSVSGLEDTAFSLDKQRLQLDAAMSERMIEIRARSDMISLQKRALLEDVGKLQGEIRDRENRIDQLKKRYDIFITSLGKDEAGQQLSATFFKVKFAAERAELRERGAALDAEIGEREQDVSALEATLRVVAAAHRHFIDSITPLTPDTVEMQELNGLTQQLYAVVDEMKVVRADIEELEQQVAEQNARLAALTDKFKQLSTKQVEKELELESLRDKVSRQEVRLQNARDVVKNNFKRAKKLIESAEDWRIFQIALWVRDYSESSHNALQALYESCKEHPDASEHFRALVAATDMQRHLTQRQRRLQLFLEKIVTDYNPILTYAEIEDVVSSSSESASSGASQTSGYTKRLKDFRKSLAGKVHEKSLLEELPDDVRKSTISLRVVTLDIEESVSRALPTILNSRRKLR